MTEDTSSTDQNCNHPTCFRENVCVYNSYSDKIFYTSFWCDSCKRNILVETNKSTCNHEWSKGEIKSLTEFEMFVFNYILRYIDYLGKKYILKKDVKCMKKIGRFYILKKCKICYDHDTEHIDPETPIKVNPDG